jgi:hypothetical protein
MSEFSSSMALSWDQSLRIFGDTVTIASVVYGCIIHGLDYADGVERGRPGRSAVVGGQVIMRGSDWAAASGRKGTQVVFSFGTFRVLNDPGVGYGSSEVVLNIGPLN